MSDLKSLLENIEGPASFTEIAKSLMCDHVIQKGDKKYAIVEVEFYLYTNAHKDIITYPRLTESGQWFFHPSGVDLTFESRDIELAENDNKEDNKKRNKKYKLGNDPLFGGILIRAIRPLDSADADIIWGPLNCVDTLWDCFDAFRADGSQYPIIVPGHPNSEGSQMRCAKRWIDIKEEKHKDRIKEWLERFTEASRPTKPENYEDWVLAEVRSEKVTNQKYLYRFFYTAEDPQKLHTTVYGAKPRYTKLPSDNHS